MSFSSKNKINFNPSTLPLTTVINNIKNKTRSGLDLQPDYQRGFIWNSEFKDKLIFSVSKNYPIGNIIIRNLEKPNKNNSKSEVVDGQQRLTSLFEFFNNKYAVNKEISKKIITENIDYYKEESSTNKVAYRILKRYNEGKPNSLKFNDFPESLKDDFRNYPLSLTFISNATTKQVSEYFRFVQNQERLKAGEIIKTIPESDLHVYSEKIVNKKMFLENINFNNSRREFDKIFYSIIGVFENKINLGSTDKKIMSYVEKHNPYLESNAEKNVINVIEAINHIGRSKIDTTFKFNKRILKLFLLLAGFKFVDFTKNTLELIDTLEFIDEKLSSFNSAKKDSIKNSMAGYDDEMIENYRLIALIVKGSHSYDRVHNRIGILADIVKYELNNKKKNVA